MAEVELSTTLKLPGAPHACVNCSFSETNGSVQGASGNFQSQLSKSLEQDAKTSEGKVLPHDGKNLPQVTESSVTNKYASDSSLTKQNKQLGAPIVNLKQHAHLGEPEESNLHISTDLNVDSIIESLGLRVNENLSEVFPQEDDALIGIESDEQNIATIIDHSDINNVVISNENPAASKLVALIPDNIRTIIQSDLRNNSNLLQNENILAVSGGIVNQANKTENISITNHLNLEKYFNNGVTSQTGEETNRLTNLQIQVDNDNAYEKYKNFFSRTIVDKDIFENLVKNNSVDSETIRNQFTTVKLETGLHNINTSSNYDTYTNLSTNNISSRTLDSSIPIVIRQGASLEQVQQDVEQSIAQNIKWVVNNKIQNARINIFPESLGQVNIALNIEDANVKINFIAASNATKELIESGITNLRSQFQESGINLQDVSVESQFSSQNNDHTQLADSDIHNIEQVKNDLELSNNELDILEKSIHINTSQSMHLLDAYA